MYLSGIPYKDKTFAKAPINRIERLLIIYKTEHQKCLTTKAILNY